MNQQNLTDKKSFKRDRQLSISASLFQLSKLTFCLPAKFRKQKKETHFSLETNNCKKFNLDVYQEDMIAAAEPLVELSV